MIVSALRTIMLYYGIVACLLFVACSEGSSSSVPTTESNAIKVFFTPKAADDSTGIYFNFKKFLQSAQTSIYGSAHEVDMIEIAELLAARAAEGLDVQLVVEERWLSSYKNSVAVQILRNSRITLIPDTRKSGLMHNKFFVVDKKKVWTGSTNVTTTCLLYNYNNAIIVENSQVAENFISEFLEQKEGKFGKRGSGKNNTPNPRVQVGEATVETYFSPEDEPLEPILSMIKNAQTSIDVLCFVFSSREIGEALVQAHQRGVKVRVLLDNGFRSERMTATWNYVPAEELSLYGIPVVFDDEEAKIHHKLIICDANEVLTGSLNLSKNGANNNDENILLVKSSAIGKIYQREFDRLWEYFGQSEQAQAVTGNDDDEIDDPYDSNSSEDM